MMRCMNEEELSRGGAKAQISERLKEKKGSATATSSLELSLSHDHFGNVRETNLVPGPDDQVNTKLSLSLL